MKKKQKNKGVSTSVVRFMALMFVVTLGYQGVKLVKVSKNLDQQIEETRKEVAVESSKLEGLNMQYENIESLDSVEQVARERLGLVKNDEIVFREKY